MREKIMAYLRVSTVCRWLDKLGKHAAAFFDSSFLGKWFVSQELPCGTGRADRLAQKFLDSRFCDFLRSGYVLRLLSRIPEAAWICLMLTAVGSMILPTLAVMILSLLTLAFTLLGLLYRTEKLPPVTGGIIGWLMFATVTLVYTFVNYGGTKGILAGGIRFVMLPLLPCAWVLLSKAGRVCRTLYVFCGASLGVGVYGLYQYLTGALSAHWTDTALFSEEMGRLTATFENPNVYGTFLLIAVPVSLLSAIFAKGWRSRVFFGVTAALLTVNMFLTYSRGCYVSLAICLFILLVAKGKAWLWAGVGALALCPLYLPESVLSRIMSIGNLADTSVSYRINIWKGVLKMLSGYWWMGVGIGDTAFKSVYESVAMTAVEDAPHAHNLFLQIMCESGVLGLLVLCILFVLLFRTAASAVHRSTGKEKWLRLSLAAAWFALLIQGLTDYIFYNNNLFAIMMISLGAMISNIKRKDEGV